MLDLAGGLNTAGRSFEGDMQLTAKVDLKAYAKGMSAIQKKQLPFATALALTEVAGHVGLSWQDEMREELDRPTPFTLGSVAVKPARRTTLVATVLIKDIAAEYLEPFVDGGPHFLGGKRGLLKPKNVTLNQYGNLTKKKLASLKAKPNVFVGPVKLRNGQVVNGVWQRGQRSNRRKGGFGTAGSHNVKHNKSMGITSLTTLKLLIRFSDAEPVTQHLDLGGRAAEAVSATIAPAFARAFSHAMATAK